MSKFLYEYQQNYRATNLKCDTKLICFCNYFSLNTEKLAELEELKKTNEALEDEVKTLRKAKGKEID